MLKLVFIAAFALLVGAGEAGAQTVKPAELVDMVKPDYPEDALGIEGVVVIRYGIDADGHVKAATISESTPPGTFDAAALEAIGKWVYRPRLVDDKPTEQPDNAIKLRFKPAPGGAMPALVEAINPDYPRKAFDDKLEGEVTFVFDVSERGLVENARMVESTPTGVFDEAARKALEVAQFAPAKVDGKPVQARDVRTTIRFRLKDARFEPEHVKYDKPEYPLVARQQGINGTCLLRYVVASDGTVEKVDLTYSVPDDIFSAACIHAVQRWTFKPPSEDTSGRIKRVNWIKFLFRIQDTRPPSQRYALKPGQWVKLDYTLGVDGRPKDIKVVEKSDPGLGESLCIEQLRQTRFSPYIDNGNPIERPHQVMTLTGPTAKEYYGH